MEIRKRSSLFTTSTNNFGQSKNRIRVAVNSSDAKQSFSGLGRIQLPSRCCPCGRRRAQGIFINFIVSTFKCNLRRMFSSRMWRCVDHGITDVSEERIASIFRVKKSASGEPASAGGCRRSHKLETSSYIRTGRECKPRGKSTERRGVGSGWRSSSR
jgi:hypothetical protein